MGPMNTKLILAAGLLFVLASQGVAEQPEKSKPKPDGKEAPKVFDKEAMQHRLQELKRMREQWMEKSGRLRFGGKGRPEAGMAEKLKHMRAEIEELHRAGKHREAEELKNKFAHEMMEGRREGPEKEQAPAERLEHLAEAIKHLRAAGINEPAESLEQMAKHMKEEMQAAKRPQGKTDEGEIHALREQVQKLMHSVEELREQVKKAQAQGQGREEAPKPQKP